MNDLGSGIVQLPIPEKMGLLIRLLKRTGKCVESLNSATHCLILACWCNMDPRRPRNGENLLPVKSKNGGRPPNLVLIVQ